MSATVLSIPALASTTSGVRPIASWRHTALLASLFVAIGVAGVSFQARAHAHATTAPQHPNMVPLLVTMIVSQWALVYAVSKALKSRGEPTLRHLIANVPATPRVLLVEAGLGLATFATWMAIQSVGRIFAHSNAASIEHLLPRGPLELMLWAVLSVTAGFCEEVAFRGYFQRQFHALTGLLSAAILLQAALFGIAHLYQGWQTALGITLYGIIFGTLATWRRSLRPGMIAHATSDLLPVLIFRLIRP